jgi:hypothetical protein
MQRTTSVGAFDSRFSNSNITLTDSGKMNSIVPNMAQLMSNQQIINSKTQQLQLESQQTHLDFTNSRINSTQSNSAAVNRPIEHSSNEFMKRDNTSASSFKSTSMIASATGQQPTSALNSNNIYQLQNTRSRYDPFPSLGNSRPIIPMTAPSPSVNLQQYRRDAGMAGILNHNYNPNSINLNQFGLKDTEVYNPYSSFNKTNTMYGNSNLTLDKYRKTKLW